MYRSDPYLSFIRTKPCLVCGNSETVPHHEPLKQAGKGIKAPDSQTIPLCAKCHHMRHQIGASFFESVDIKMEIIRLLTKYLEERGL